MKVEVLGTGCARCNELEAMARSVAARAGVECEIGHVHDITEIVRRGILATPALAIDGEVVVSGRMPSETELEELLTSSET